MGFEQLKELDPLLVRIDAMQARVNDCKAEKPDAYNRIMEGWAIESTYHSNTIEGSTLSLGDTALLYEGAAVDAPADDVHQAEGGFAALRFLRQAIAEGALFSEQMIRRAHELAFAEAKDPLTRGVYRTVEVEITGTAFEPAPAAYVPERMASLVGSVARSRRHAVLTSALFHLEFESIHPFVNANGRVGRLMSNLLLMQAGYEPVNIQAESRARYIAAIRAFQLDDDPYPFALFFCENLEERLERVFALLGGHGEAAGREGANRVGSYLAGDEQHSQSINNDVPKYQNDTLDCTLEEFALLRFIGREPSATQAEMAAAIGKSVSTVKRLTVSLQKKGLLERVGGKRAGHWVVLADVDE